MLLVKLISSVYRRFNVHFVIETSNIAANSENETFL